MCWFCNILVALINCAKPQDASKHLHLSLFIWQYTWRYMNKKRYNELIIQILVDPLDTAVKRPDWIFPPQIISCALRTETRGCNCCKGWRLWAATRIIKPREQEGSNASQRPPVQCLRSYPLVTWPIALGQKPIAKGQCDHLSLSTYLIQRSVMGL